MKALLQFVKFPCKEQEVVVSCARSSHLSFNRYINEISGLQTRKFHVNKVVVELKTL